MEEIEEWACVFSIEAEEQIKQQKDSTHPKKQRNPTKITQKDIDDISEEENEKRFMDLMNRGFD